MKIKLTSVEEVPENGSWLFTVTEAGRGKEEVILVRCDGGIEAYKNFCLHEPDQRLDVGRGAAIRAGEIICPRHGSMYDTCSGYCDNGEAKGTTLVAVEITVEDGDVYLTDDDLFFEHTGPIDDGDDGPNSTSHIQF